MPGEREVVALAERCEAATGPDRELDVAILRAVTPGAKQFRPKSSTARKIGLTECEGVILPQPHYTRSLDAALTLVPEDRLWVRMDEWHADEGFIPPRPSASVYRRATAADGTSLKGAGAAATLTLALCAAALRARAAAEEARDGG